MAWGGFLLGGEMVFLVRETLTEEDRAAWRRLRDKRIREVRRERRRNTLGWLADVLSAFLCTAMGAAALYAIARGKMSAWYLLAAPFMLVGGACILLTRGRIPARETGLLPGEELPFSDTVRAVFFGDGCFAFWDTSGKVRMGYSSIHDIWEDEGRFYLFFKDRPPLVVRKSGLGRWMPEDFRDFLENTLGFPVERVK